MNTVATQLELPLTVETRSLARRLNRRSVYGSRRWKWDEKRNCFTSPAYELTTLSIEQAQHLLSEAYLESFYQLGLCPYCGWPLQGTEAWNQNKKLGWKVCRC